MRTGVEEAGFVFNGHLETQTQRPLDGDAGVAEVGVVEDLRGVTRRKAAVEPNDLGDLVAPILLLADLATLVAEATAHGNVKLARVEELDLALAALLLAVGDDPDIGADPGVVEHLLGQGDEGFEPVVLDDPLADVALARTRAAREKWRSAEHNRQARAVFVLLRQDRLEFADHVLQEQQRATVDARQASTKATGETLFVVFRLNLLLLL